MDNEETERGTSGGTELIQSSGSTIAAANPSNRRILERFDREVKELSLYDIVSRYTELKPSGPQFKGLSPFTMEKTPSFYVNPTKLGGCWKCFSTGEGGRGVNSFIEKVKKHGFSRLEQDILPPLKPEEDCEEGELPF